MCKSIIPILFFFCSFLTLPLYSASDQELEHELNLMLLLAGKPGERNLELDKQLQTWPGGHTREGIDVVVKAFLKSSEGSSNRALAHIIRNTSLEQTNVATIIQENADKASQSGNMNSLHSAFFLLSRFPNGDGTLRYFASYFADDRVIETEERGPEDYLGNPGRVSDYASGLTRGLLEEWGRWGSDDPTYFREPNDGMTWEGRDKVKDAINAYLLREGIITEAQHPSHKAWATPKSSNAVPMSTPTEQNPPTIALGKNGKETVKVRPWIWISASIVLILAIFRFLRSRRVA